jgi:hypothetical protein
MRILEIGSYVSIAYAGMVLAEQGHSVTKWLRQDAWDPVLDLQDGDSMWHWLCQSKTIMVSHAAGVLQLRPGQTDLIIDNLRAEAWERWGVDPAYEAKRLGVRWVSLRDDFDGRSFDAIAQARAWGDHIGYVPAYLGDTAAGLWVAFKATADRTPGHYVVRQAALLAKLVEGELAVTPHRDGRNTPWDLPGQYGRNPDDDGVQVLYRGEWVTEPYRDAEWRREHLRHIGGRFTV